MTVSPTRRSAAAALLLALAAGLLVVAPPAPAQAQSGPTLTIKDAQAFSDQGPMKFTVTLSQPAGSSGVHVHYQTFNGTAIGSSNPQPGTHHFTSKGGDVEFGQGVQEQTIEIDLVGQTAPDRDRTFTVQLSQPQNATISRGTATGTIYNSRGPTVSFKSPTESVNQPAAGESRTRTFTVQAVGQASGARAWEGPVEVRFRTRDITDPEELAELDQNGQAPAKAGTDYDAVEGVLTIPPSSSDDHTSEATIEVTVHGNNIYQGGQQVVFKVELLEPAFGVFEGTDVPRVPETARGLINDTDDPPTVTIGSIAVGEGNSGNTPAVVPITLSHPSIFAVNLVHATADGTATVADNDYVPISPGTPVPTIPPLATRGSATVHIKGDTRIEPNEHFFVDFARANPNADHVNLPEDNKRATVTILNDDGPYLTITDVEGPQGGEGEVTPFEFTVRLHQVPSGWTHTVEVDYATIDGTARTDQPGFERYRPVEGTLSFAPGETTKTISVDVLGNNRPGFHQIFYVDLSEVRVPGQPNTIPPVPTLFKARGVGTIFNDDGPHLRVADAVVLRNQDALLDAVFKVTLSEALECPDWFHQLYGCDVLLEYRTVDGSAKAGEHYQAAEGTLRIPRGDTEAEIVVKVPGSSQPGPSYVFGLELGMAELAQTMNRHATGEIRNDVGPELTVGDVTIERPHGGEAQAVFPITLAEPAPENASVRFATVDDSAAAGRDFVGRSGTLEIPQGATTGQIVVRVTSARGVAPEATFKLALSQPAYIKLGNDAGIGTLIGGLQPGDVIRTFGADRIKTAVAISSTFWGRSEEVVLATARNYPDALAAGALAAKLGAPLLLTEKDTLPAEVAAEVSRLGAQRAWVMGGTAAVGEPVEAALAGAGVQVRRLAGSDRFATAARVAAQVGASDGEVLLALGEHEVEHRAWPDALSAGALAASDDQIPTLLTRGESLPAQTEQALAELGATSVYVIGGRAAISDAVVARLQALGLEVFRLAGPDRYATSAAVANEALRRSEPGRVPIVFSTGHNFPDGLAAAGLTAQIVGVLLLVPPDDLAVAPATGEFLPANKPKLGGGVVTGGTAAVSDAVVDQIRAALKPDDSPPPPEPGTETEEATP
jgi:putative cell wall-binding protein